MSINIRNNNEEMNYLDLYESFSKDIIKKVKNTTQKDKRDLVIHNVVSTYVIRNLEERCKEEDLNIFDVAVHDNSIDDSEENVEIILDLLYDNLDISEDIHVSIEIMNGDVYISAHDDDYYYVDVKAYEIYGDSIKDKFNMLIEKLKSILYNVEQIVQQNIEYDKYLEDQENEAAWNDPNYVRDEEGDVNEW